MKQVKQQIMAMEQIRWELAHASLQRRSRYKSWRSTEEARMRAHKTFRLVMQGWSYAAAGRAIGVSGTRAKQIVRLVLHSMRHPSRITSDSPALYTHDIRELRKHANYLIRRSQELELQIPFVSR